MAELKIYDMKGKASGNINLNDEVFGVKYNEALIHQVVVAQLANKRQGTKCTLTRSEVRGGGKKPWRQKGTGRARQGSTRSPQWVKGGVVFAPKPRDFSKKINKKMNEGAFKSAVSQKLRDNDIVALKKLEFKELKTKNMVEVLNNLMELIKKDKAGKPEMKKVLIITDVKDEAIMRVAGNIPNVEVTFAEVLSVYEVVKSAKIIATETALKKLEEVYA